MIPVAPEIKGHLQEIKPDIVVAMPLISGDSREGEYVQAASTLHIPTVFSMFSWDNLSTKGTFHSQTDFHLVWNEPLAQELVQLHHIPRDSIFITGAPRFDRLSNHCGEYILPREEFCRIVGMDPEKKFILYVGSTFILDSQFKQSRAEERLILEIANTLQKHRDTTEVHVLARPHPQNAGIVAGLKSENRENISIYPIAGELPDTEEKMRMFDNSIFHSIAVVGINTTAFLEAAALDKPCVTVVEKMASATHRLPHFRHLADAGFLETAHETGELVKILARIIQGEDAKANLRQKFVMDFIRPSGHPAVERYVNFIEVFAARHILPTNSKTLDSES
jgi:hypothetical protein